MNIFESINSAFASVASNKLRTFLTMIGIIIGISSVIMITSIGNGFQASLNKEFDKLGMDLIAIYVRGWDTMTDKDKLTIEDVELLQNNDKLRYVAPLSSSSAKADMKNGGEIIISIMGTTEEYKKSMSMELIYGRFLTDRDVANKSKTVVIDDWTAIKVFGYADVVDKSFRITSGDTEMDVTVIGVLKSENSEVIGNFSNGTMYMPYNTENDFSDKEGYIDNIYAGVYDTDKISSTTAEIMRLLSIKHNNEDMYGVESVMQQISVITTVLTGITLFIAFVAAISLLVGGIGVMNIMLVTVTERTKEIGIRKSLGATDSNIKTQFLIEAMILSVIGGIIGVILGYLGGQGLSSVIGMLSEMEMESVVSVPVVIATVIISSMIGIIFGVYPASKAAKLDPIEALRHE